MSLRARVLVVVSFAFSLGLFVAAPAPASAHEGEAQADKPLVKAEDPSRGMRYDGLVDAAGDSCVGSFRVKTADVGKVVCSHGPDVPLPSQDVASDATAAMVAPAAASPVECYGTGSDGYRVEAIYAVASDRTDRYSSLLTTLQNYAKNVDNIYVNSAAQTGGLRHVRFITDQSCVVVVRHVVMSATGDDSFGNTMSELSAQGYNRSDRKYMTWVDANVYCGIGNVSGDSSKSSSNWNNVGPDYARSDNGCWGGHTEAHELTHTLGGVQLNAPHTSGGYHCVDERDVMCYSDSPSYPAMQYLCTASSSENILDCNHDDYFHTSPLAGNYLATHWNVADSRFLATVNGGPQLELFADVTTPPTTLAAPPPRLRPVRSDHIWRLLFRRSRSRS